MATKSSASTWAPRTRWSPSWRAATRSSSPTPRAGGRPRRSSVHQGRRAARRPGRQAPGRHQPQEHRLLDQALHGPQDERGPGRDQARPVQGRRRARTTSPPSRSRASGTRPPEISAMILQKMKQTAEDYLGQTVTQGGRHGARVLQRRAAPGHEGRRQDRRPRRAPHHQRADGRRARLRARQEEGREDRRVRPRRRHVRHLRARAVRRRRLAPVRGEVDQRRHAPGRRRLRPARHRLDRRRVQEATRASTSPRTRWRSSA